MSRQQLLALAAEIFFEIDTFWLLLDGWMHGKLVGVLSSFRRFCQLLLHGVWCTHTHEISILLKSRKWETVSSKQGSKETGRQTNWLPEKTFLCVCGRYWSLIRKENKRILLRKRPAMAWPSLAFSYIDLHHQSPIFLLHLHLLL